MSRIGTHFKSFQKLITILSSEQGIDLDFEYDKEKPASQQSHLKQHSPTLQISEEGFTDSELHKSGDPTVRSEKRHHFSEAARALLQKFFHHKPYPTEEEKRDLAEKTGGTKKQITTWFGNTRRRAVPRSKDQVLVSLGFPVSFTRAFVRFIVLIIIALGFY